jgi:serine/threonine protein kinase
MDLKIVNEKNNFYFHRDGLIGKGGFGNVFRGNFLDQSVAVKRILLTNIQGVLNSREETFLTQLQHDNIVKLLHIENDDDFR